MHYQELAGAPYKGQAQFVIANCYCHGFGVDESADKTMEFLV